MSSFSLNQLSAPERLRLLQRAESRQTGQRAVPLQGIPALQRDQPLPASYAQERMWFLCTQMEAVGKAYHIPIGLRLTGALDDRALQRALDRLLARHEALRTTFVKLDGQLVHRIADAAIGIGLQRLDLRGQADAEAVLMQHARDEALRDFDLAAGPLVRAGLVRLADEVHVLLITMHHIVSDGWSIGVVTHELSVLYNAFAQGRPDPLPALAVQYPDFAAWQRQWLAGDVLRTQSDHWKRQLADAPTLITLPTDRPRPARQDHVGAIVHLRLGRELAQQLKALGQRHGSTPFMTLLAGWAVLLARLSGQDDVVIGTPIANRMRAEVQPLVGFFVNTLALRLDVSGTPRVSELLQRVRALARGSQQHQDLPFEQVVELVRPTRSLSHAPLFQVMFAWQDAGTGQPDFGGLQVDVLKPPYDIAKFDLSLSLSEDGDDIVGELEYATALFDRATVERFASHYRRLLAGMVAEADPTPALLPLMDDAERRRLLVQWNATQAPTQAERCVHELFERQAALRGRARAVVQGDQAIGYGELNARANRLAVHLRQLGVGPEARVAVCMQRGIDMVTALLATWKAGGAYVPMDPAHPAERLAAMLQDCTPVVVLADHATQARVRDALARAPAPLLRIDDDAEAWAHASPDDQPPGSGGATPAHLAYVIYTSGSTGQPKGVMVEHRHLANLVAWHNGVFDLRAGDRASSVAGFGFDAAAWEMWPPLSIGATLVLPTPEAARDPGSLVDWWCAQSLDLSFLPTPVAELAFVSGRLNRQLRTLLIGGDRLRQLPDGPLPFRLVNNYGPTENTVVSTSGELQPGDTVLHIGRPIANTSVYILDAHGQPVPVGVVGELVVGGEQVARGYLNRPDLTRERFLDDPFRGVAGARMYRTGDLARYLPDGQIEFIGRNDFQVKVRGLRIELGEIEAGLMAHPAVREAVVVARGEADEERQLVAYWTSGAAADAWPPVDALRIHLLQRLPDYMVPAAYVPLDALPLTANGKIDRDALPAPQATAYAARGHEAPQGETETALAALWAELLGIDEVGRHDNFFELGGHSLLAVKLASRMRKQGLHADVGLLFATPTLAQLAARIGDTAAAPVDVPPNRIPPGCGHITPDMLPLVQLDDAQLQQIAAGVDGGMANIQDIYPLAPLQEGILFHHLMTPQGDPYLLHSVVRFERRARLDEYMRCLQSVVDRHDILRTAVAWQGLPEPVQVVWRRAPLPLEEVALDPAGGDAGDQLLARFDPRRHRLDLGRAPLVRTVIAQDPADGCWVMLQCYHHLSMDHTTLDVVHHEVQAFLGGQSSTLPPPLPFRNFVAQAKWGLSTAEHEAFFSRMLSDIDEPTAPFGQVRVAGDGRHVQEHRLDLDAGLATRLRESARQLGVSVASVCHLAWAQVLARVCGRDDVVFGTVLFGRLQGGEGAHRVPGLFINTLPLRVSIDDATVPDAVRRLHAELADLLRHEHAPLALAQRCSGVAAPTPLFSSLLNFRHSATAGQAPDEHGRAAWHGIEVLHVEERTNYPLTLSVDDLGSGFAVSVQAGEGLSPQRVCAYMHRALQQVVHALDTAPQTPQRQVDVMGAEERDTVLVRWNATGQAFPDTVCVHELVQDQVRQRPDAVALVQGDLRWTYAELDAHANRLAHQLRARGVTAEDRVALCLPLGIELVLGLLATLKAGGAYVPMDPAYPAERLRHILADSAPRVVLSQGRFADAVAPLLAPGTVLVRLDAPLSRPFDQPAAAIPAAEAGVHARSLAYVIYTSGSTGVPQGVMVEHRSLCNLVHWHVRRFGLQPGTRTAAMAGVGFDASTWEIWPSLCAGGTLLLPPAALADVDARVRWWRGQAAELGFVVTSLVDAALGDDGPPTTLRHLLVGGDRLQRRPALAPGQTLVNNYGPTEATVVATSGTLNADDAALDIGRPIANTRIYLLDAHRRPVPVGVAGEMFIAGDGLARGYLNRPDLTAERFVDDPFAGAQGGRLYRTGDLARHLPDGRIEFIGRNDFQVKIRGFRVELGEIEAQLARLPGVREAVVLAREDEPGQTRLVAYLTGEVSGDEGLVQLRAALAQHLPEHMVPAAWVSLPRLPLTANGKLDRRALPAPQASACASPGYEPPSGDIEEELARLWAELLPGARIGRHDDFFALGGHSLSAMRLVARLRQAMGVDITLQSLFQTSGFAALADHILDERLSMYEPSQLEAGAALL